MDRQQVPNENQKGITVDDFDLSSDDQSEFAALSIVETDEEKIAWKIKNLEVEIGAIKKEMENIKLTAKADSMELGRNVSDKLLEMSTGIFTANSAIQKIEELFAKREANSPIVDQMTEEKLTKMNNEISELRQENNELKEKLGKIVGEKVETQRALQTLMENNSKLEQQMAELKDQMTKLNAQKGTTAEEKNIRLIGIRAKANECLVCTEDYGKKALFADRESNKEWEPFRLVENNDSTISLRSFTHDKFVRVDLGIFGIGGKNRLCASSDVIGHMEKFWMEKADKKDGEGTFALKAAANGKYVCADLENGGILVANRDVAKKWEHFEMIN